MAAPEIPVFNVDPDRKAFCAAFDHVTRGKGAYGWQDVCRVSDWIGICAFTYMAETYRDKKGVALTAADLQDFNLYHYQCMPTVTIMNDILKRTPVDFTLCYTRKPCQELLSHSSVLAHFHPREGRRISYMTRPCASISKPMRKAF